MSSFTTILFLAFILVTFALICLGVGYFFGKKKLANRCGYSPDTNKDEKCNSTKRCSLCHPEDTKKEK